MAEGKQHFFEFKEFNLANWSYGQLLRYLPPSLSDLSRRQHKAAIREAQTNQALLEISSVTQIASVLIRQEKEGLHLTCDCSETDGHQICVFQLQAILNVVENTDLRIFFDEEKRGQLLQREGEKYGLEAPGLFLRELEIVWHENRPLVKPINEHLQAADPDTLLAVSKRLQPDKASLPNWNETAIRVLVWTQSRFGDNFQLFLYEAFRTGNGKLKGPMRQLHAVDLLLEADTTEQLKFYGAVAKFQDSHRVSGQVTDRQAFYWLLQNPDNLPVFIHHFSISETVAAHALKEVEMVAKKMEMSLTVHQSGDFYEIVGVLTIDGKVFDLLETKLRYGGFLLAGERLHLIEREGLAELLGYLQEHRNKLILHKNKYEMFRQDVLQKVESHTRVVYTYLRKPGTRKRQELQLETPPEKILYLDDAGQYVHLTPVMRYGAVEMPVLSPRVLYLIDKQGRAFQAPRDTKAELAFATSMMLMHPGFVEQLGQGYVYLHKSKFLQEDWFLKAFEQWRSEGISILGFKEIQGNRLSEHPAKVNVNVISGIDWFETKVEVRFGGEIVPLRQLFTSIRNKTRYVALTDGTVGVLPQKWMDLLTQYAQIGGVSGDTLKTRRHHFQHILEYYDDEYLSPTARKELALLAETLQSINKVPEIVLPKGLKTPLRDYQYEGVKWLHFMGQLNLGACLADDMGLGKTLQIIALLLLQKQEHPGKTSLIVMPASLIFNWQEEIRKHAPELSVGTYYATGRNRDFSEQQKHDLILTTYSVMVAAIDKLRVNNYHYVILDESQNIKNPSSQRYRAACQLKARNRLIVTGTPIENNTYDLYAQFSFVCPGLLGSRRYFKAQYATTIDKFRESARTEELQARIRPFMLRRTKEQVARQLPSKTEMTIYCEMGVEQRRVYDAYAAEFRNYLNGRSDGDVAREKLHILQGLTKLRQICMTPAILNDEEYFGADSAKITILLEQLTSLVDHHKILVFSQFVTVLDLIKTELESRNIGYCYLVGATRKRGEVVETFQQDSSKRVFLISLKAGGTGLNLTAADYVFLMDPWWNPAIENQAIDRTHRMGQEKPVVAVRMICPDTIEERVVQLQHSKRGLTDELIHSDDSIVKTLDREGLLRLV